MKKKKIELLLANPRGFCAGVERAIEIVEKALEKYGPGIYVKHEIVHNKHVVDTLKAKGVIFVDDLKSAPPGSIIIFSAHGVAKSVEDAAANAALHVIDATCPLVKKVHNEAIRYVSSKRKVILIGHAGHAEVEGTRGRVDAEVSLVQNVEDVLNLPFATDEKLAYVTQTTLSIDDTRDIINALNSRFTDITGPSLNDICYATQNRQDAVKALAKTVDLLLVIGAKNSSNSNRLRDLGQACGVESHLIADERDINLNWLQGKKVVGITAGASAPAVILKNVLDFFRNHYDTAVKEMSGAIENIKFKLPAELNNI